MSDPKTDPTTDPYDGELAADADLGTEKDAATGDSSDESTIDDVLPDGVRTEGAAPLP